MKRNFNSALGITIAALFLTLVATSYAQAQSQWDSVFSKPYNSINPAAPVYSTEVYETQITPVSQHAPQPLPWNRVEKLSDTTLSSTNLQQSNPVAQGNFTTDPVSMPKISQSTQAPVIEFQHQGNVVVQHQSEPIQYQSSGFQYQSEAYSYAPNPSAVVYAPQAPSGVACQANT